MDKQTEMEIRAQSMINSLGQQRLAALDQTVYAQAEIALRDAKIVELRNEIESLKVPAEPVAA